MASKLPSGKCGLFFIGALLLLQLFTLYFWKVSFQAEYTIKPIELSKAVARYQKNSTKSSSLVIPAPGKDICAKIEWLEDPIVTMLRRQNDVQHLSNTILQSIEQVNKNPPDRINIAVLLVTSNSSSAQQLIDNLCQYLVDDTGIFLGTFFIFGIKDNNSLNCTCGTVVKVAGNIGSAILDQCQLYTQNMHMHGYFDPEKFQTVFSFDSSVRLINRVNLRRLLSEVFFSFAHMSLIEKYGRWSTGAEVFTSKLFGGQPGKVLQLCQALQYNLSTPFQLRYNDYVKKGLPFNNRIIFLGGEDCLKLRDVKHFVFTKLISINFESHDMDYWQYLEVRDELEKAKCRQQKAEAVSEEIRTNLFAQTSKRMEKGEEVKFVTATCRFPEDQCFDDFFINADEMIPIQLQKLRKATSKNVVCFFQRQCCNGLGDRLRGTVTALYLAIAIGRAFRVDWVRPADVAEYFQVNENFYNAELSAFQTQLSRALTAQRYLLHRGDIPDAALMTEMKKDSFIDDYANVSSLNFMTNRFAGIEGIFQSSRFSQVLRKTLPTLFGSNHNVTDFVPAISGALRAILSSPNEKLTKLFDDVIVQTIGTEYWRKSIKIGVQIRTEKIETDIPTRVSDDQINCFIQEVERIIALKIRNPFFNDSILYSPITIFVTADWKLAVDIIKSAFETTSQLKVFATTNLFGLTLTHIDKPVANVSDGDMWLKSAETFLDWHILTQMDFLVISRSGFGESASLMSLKPTRRFMHGWYHDRGCSFDDYYEETSTLHTSPTVDIYDIL